MDTHTHSSIPAVHHTTINVSHIAYIILCTVYTVYIEGYCSVHVKFSKRARTVAEISDCRYTVWKLQ